MNYFQYNDIYEDKAGQKVLRVNILPEKSCTFNCGICPLTKARWGETTDFGPIEDSLKDLGEKIKELQPQVINLRGNGEPLTNDKIEKVIDFVHEQGLKVTLYSNGYLLGQDSHMVIASKCDEVMGCFMCLNERDFHRLHVGLPGYSCEGHIASMERFSKQYKGKFIMKVTIMKTYNESEERLPELKAALDRMQPDELEIETLAYGKAAKILGVSDERLQEVIAYLNK